jgi:hypothetical protein
MLQLGQLTLSSYKNRSHLINIYLRGELDP